MAEPTSFAELIRPTLSVALNDLASRFAAADQLAFKAAVLGQHADRKDALVQREAASAAFFTCEAAAGELFFFLLRAAMRHNRAALRTAISKVLADELEQMSEAIATLELHR